LIKPQNHPNQTSKVSLICSDFIYFYVQTKLKQTKNSNNNIHQHLSELLLSWEGILID